MKAEYKDAIDRAILHLENALADLKKLQARKTLARMSSWCETNPADAPECELRSAEKYVRALEILLRPPEPTRAAPVRPEPDLGGDQHVQIRRAPPWAWAMPATGSSATQAIDLFSGGGS